MFLFHCVILTDTNKAHEKSNRIGNQFVISSSCAGHGGHFGGRLGGGGGGDSIGGGVPPVGVPLGGRVPPGIVLPGEFSPVGPFGPRGQILPDSLRDVLPSISKNKCSSYTEP